MDKKVKAAIIDSGILGSLNYQVSESINYYVIDDNIRINKDIEDFCGHGTACAHMIHHLCPDVEFRIVKVFESTLYTHPALIVNAFEYLTETDIDIVNVSLSLRDASYMTYIEELYNIMIKQGKVVVSAIDNNYHQKNYLNDLENMICVKGELLPSDNCFLYNRYNSPVVLANSLPSLIPFRDNYYYFADNSRATAIVTGLLCQLFKKSDDATNRYSMAIQYLQDNSFLNNWNENDVLQLREKAKHVNVGKLNDEDTRIVNILETLYSKYIDINIKKTPCINLFDYGLNRINCLQLIRDIENKFSIKFELFDLEYPTICSFVAMYYAVKNRLNERTL